MTTPGHIKCNTDECCQECLPKDTWNSEVEELKEQLVRAKAYGRSFFSDYEYPRFEKEWAEEVVK